jgi:hypothetical protein
MPADMDEMLTFVKMLARMRPVDIDSSDDALEDTVATLNSLIHAARIMTSGAVVTLNERELATVLAALRAYQNVQQHEALAPEIAEIATNGGRLPLMDDSEIDDLCESINCD